MPPLDGEAEQLAFWDDGRSNMRKLKARAEELRANRRAQATSKAYDSDLRIFQQFCHSIKRDSQPAAPETLALFAAQQLESLSPSTVNRRLSAVRSAHAAAGLPAPSLADARAVISGAKREKRRPNKAKLALTVEQLSLISDQLKRESSPIAIRNRAIMVFGFATGMRRSELANLDLADLQPAAAGLTVTIRKSKTDQQHRGRTIGLFRARHKRLCPIAAIKQWIRIRGRKPGPLLWAHDARTRQFKAGSRMDPEHIGDLVQKQATAIGLRGQLYGGHSLRAGMVTAALETGASESSVMRRTGHKSRETLDRYLRPATQFSSDPLAKAL